MEDFETDLNTLRVRRAALEEQLIKAEPTRGHSRINFATLTLRLILKDAVANEDASRDA